MYRKVSKECALLEWVYTVTPDSFALALLCLPCLLHQTRRGDLQSSLPLSPTRLVGESLYGPSISSSQFNKWPTAQEVPLRNIAWCQQSDQLASKALGLSQTQLNFYTGLMHFTQLRNEAYILLLFSSGVFKSTCVI